MSNTDPLGMLASKSENENLDLDDYKHMQDFFDVRNNFKNTAEFLNSLNYTHVSFTAIRDSKHIQMELDWFTLKGLVLLGEAARKDLEVKDARNSK